MAGLAFLRPHEPLGAKRPWLDNYFFVICQLSAALLPTSVRGMPPDVDNKLLLQQRPLGTPQSNAKEKYAVREQHGKREPDDQVLDMEKMKELRPEDPGRGGGKKDQ